MICHSPAHARMEFLCWDPTAKSRSCWSPCSLPLSLAWLNQPGTDSSWEVVRIMDAFLHQVGDYFKVLLFDGEGCNTLIRKIVHGVAPPEVMIRLDQTFFFKELSHTEIPGLSQLPRCPIRMCLIKDDPFFALTAPQHASKNASAQMMSEIRVLFCGRYAVDATGTLQANMPAPAFSRKDPMSDRLNSLLCNPMFMLREQDTKGNQPCCDVASVHPL